MQHVGLTVNVQERQHAVMESKQHLQQEDGLLVSTLPLPMYLTLGKLTSVGPSSLTSKWE